MSFPETEQPGMRELSSRTSRAVYVAAAGSDFLDPLDRLDRVLAASEGGQTEIAFACRAEAGAGGSDDMGGIQKAQGVG